MAFEEWWGSTGERAIPRGLPGFVTLLREFAERGYDAAATEAEQNALGWHYALGQLVRWAPASVPHRVIQRRYTERRVLPPFREYCITAESGYATGEFWVPELDLLPWEERPTPEPPTVTDAVAEGQRLVEGTL